MFLFTAGGGDDDDASAAAAAASALLVVVGVSVDEAVVDGKALDVGMALIAKKKVRGR